MPSVVFANITNGRRKAFNFVAEQTKHVAALVEAHLGESKARRAPRQMQPWCGYKAWLSHVAKPTVAGAPPRGGAMIAARAYLDVRQIEVTSGLGSPVDAELKQRMSLPYAHTRVA